MPRKRPEVKRIDEFRYDKRTSPTGHVWHEQSYFVFFKDPNLEPKRMNAMDLDEVHIEAYWEQVNETIARSKTADNGFTEKCRERLKLFEAAMEHKKVLEEAGIEFFTGCNGKWGQEILASMDAKIALSSDGKAIQKELARREAVKAKADANFKAPKAKVPKTKNSEPTASATSSSAKASEKAIVKTPTNTSARMAAKSSTESTAGTSGTACIKQEPESPERYFQVKREPESPDRSFRVKEEPRSVSPQFLELRRSRRARKQRNLDQDVQNWINKDSSPAVAQNERRSSTPESWKSK